jgi:chemotaxis protein methyltransferase CheR
MAELSDREFMGFKTFVHQAAGIDLSPSKKALVAGRLSKRVRDFGLSSYAQYLELLTSGRAPAEAQNAVDLLTTNETYFFREPKHFDVLQRAVASRKRGPTFRVWSAASSSGEEAYSIAMVLADKMEGAPWEVMGSDISTRVLDRARRGQYPVNRADKIPTSYLRSYCLRGTKEDEGSLLVCRDLRKQVEFKQLNLTRPLPDVGLFDVIFLRNVLIYFNAETKQQVVGGVLPFLKPGGLFFVSHSETLNDVAHDLLAVAPAVYRRPVAR